MSPLWSILHLLACGYKFSSCDDEAYSVSDFYDYSNSGKYFYQLNTIDFIAAAFISCIYFFLYFIQLYLQGLRIEVAKQSYSISDLTSHENTQLLNYKLLINRMLYSTENKEVTKQLLTLRGSIKRINYFTFLITSIGIGLVFVYFSYFFAPSNITEIETRHITICILIKSIYFLFNTIKLEIYCNYSIRMFDQTGIINENLNLKRETFEFYSFIFQYLFIFSVCLYYVFPSLNKGCYVFFITNAAILVGSLFLVSRKINEKIFIGNQMRKLEKSFEYIENEKEDEVCAICHEKLTTKRKIKSCGHCFHL